MKEALATVEICVLCGWRFLNNFVIVSETPSSCDTVQAVRCSELYFVRCCTLKQTGKYPSESKVNV